jgi:hypothetical protein
MNIWQVSVDGYSHTRAFDTVALCLRESIIELGFQSEIVSYPNPVENHIILGAHLLQGSVPKGYIIYNLEQITSESPLVSENYINLLKLNRVWDYSKRNIKELNKLGIEAIHMPIGYHPCLTKIPEGYLQQIDCLFYGSLNLRRKTIIEATGATPIFDIYGDELDTCIASSKIILNCHYYNTQLFEIVRCSYLMANKKFIVSEPGLDLELEEPFREGIAFHKKEEMPEAVEYYLANPDVRAKIAQKGFEIFSQIKQTEYLKNESKSW